MPILFVLGLAACSSPAVTDRQPGLKGYGVEPVSGDSLSTMLARCSQSRPQVVGVDRGTSLDAECNQLHRTLHNQPGNSVTPGATP
ncbi:hypothetical protein HN018_03365 [Lichenicola cladoniae]|uniref:Uncharacterized protein n=1 Tax=Lichenicola cladoniae TaxID=1484109 RepID=A0A6M8HLJ6_9PROT|nr:hypothetical protein [Lichenicola cladoniae]NPD66024.1 hypothetical protein [Acetobacteraceae bacterium]QKE89210.1 hypothetical protein HN018_03365 [Lichenicola cladoniae]